jgi:hypothetical protein
MSNVYADYIRSKGRDLPGPSTAPIPEYPRTIGWKTFESHEEYLEHLADFLNGQ